MYLKQYAGKFVMWCIFVCGLFIPEAGATDYQRIIGGSSTQQLRITVFAGGRYFVERWSGSVWTPQFYPLPKTPLFSLRIGATIYESQNLSKEDVSYTGTGALREMTKRFSGTHQGKPFSVLFSIHYNTSNPDYFTQSATVDVSSIAASTPVKLAYGFDSYVNGCDAAAAITIPDLGYNGVANTPATVRYLTPAQVQSLRMVGAMNTFGAGSLIGFFAMGRPFNYAVSAYYTNAYDNTSPEIRMMNTTTNPFLFGLYAFTELTCPGGSPWDNGIGVAYEIPAGETTTIWTGLSFTTDMDGELDYTWNGSKNHTANVGDSVNLELRYESYNSQTISGIGFHVAIPGLAIEDVCTQTGFTSGVFTGVIGSQFYNVSGAAINAYDSAVMRIPVDILQCGQWIIDANSISAMVRTLPLGSPATLTVPSKIGFATTATPITVCRGDSAQYTVRLPGNVTSSGSFTVNLAVTGNTSAFGAVPSSIAFPAGTNSISFPVWALPGAPAGSSLTITLTGSDKSYIGLNDTLQTTVTVHVATPNVITAQHIAVCEGEETAVAAISQDATATLTWYSDAGGTNIVAQADSFNITATADTVFYVRSTSLNSCPNAASVTVSVSQPPVLITADTSTCAGTPAVITATTAGTATLLWYSDTQYSLLRSSAASFSVTATADSTYYVKAATGDGCSRYDSVHLSVFPFPTLTTHDVAICGGGTVSVAATTTNGSDVLTWYADAACTAPLPLANSFTYTATTDSTFYIKATAGGICSVYDSARIAVHAIPALAVRPDTAACAGASIAIFAATGNPSDTLRWYRDAAHTSLITSSSSFNISASTTTTYYIKATSPHSCTAQGSVHLSVFPFPTLTTHDVAICGGGTVTVEGATTNGSDVLTWYADAACTAPLPLANSFTYTATADSTFYIKATAGGICNVYDSARIAVHAIPALTVRPDTAACAGASIAIFAATGNPSDTLRWYRDAAHTSLITSSSSFNISAATTTTYYIKATSPHSCTAQGSVHLSVFPFPTLTTHDVAICGGGTVTVAATTTNGSDVLTWYSDAACTAPLPLANSFTYTATTDSTFYIKATAGGICNVYDSARIAVHAIPALTVRPDTAACAGASIAIFAATGNPSDTLRWYRDAAHTSLITSSSSFNISAATTTTYYIKATSPHSCTAQGSVHLSVFPFPTLTTHDVAICGGGTVTVAAATTNGSDALTWYADAACTAPLPLANSFTYTATADSTFYIKATAGGICSVYDSARIAVHAIPALTVRPDTAACAGASIAIFAATGNPSDTLRWYRDAAHTSLIASSSSFNISAATTTTYYIKATSPHSCTAQGSVHLSVFPFPTLTTHDVAICGGGTVTVAAATTNGSDVLTWYADAACTAPLPLANSFTYTATADSTFYIKATAGGICSVYDSARVLVSSFATISVRPDTAICAGASIDIYASTPNVSDALSWYSDPLHSAPVASAAAFNTTPATSTTYYVKAISTDGCTSSGKVEITVFRVPVLTDSDTTVCSGAAIALNASTGNPADTLRWYADAGYTTLLTQAFSLTTTSLSGADTTFYIEASAAPGGCRTKAAINVRIESPPSVIATDGRRICYGEEITLATTHADGNISWNTPQLTLRPTASQTYTVTASRPPCPDAADTLVITVGNQLYIAPDALPPYRRNILYQQQLSTNATPPVFTLADGQLPAGILFATDGAIEGTPFKIEYNDAGYPFRVQITDSFGCTVTKDYKLTGGFFIPEVFSPNNDGLNDHFMKGLRVIIFDRLGRRLFDGTDGWDGTHNGRTVPDDVYFYIIYYLENGTHEVRKTGFITVVQ